MDKILFTSIEFSDLIHSLREVVKEEILNSRKQELTEKLLFPAETCKLFQPEISKVTLSSWTDQSLLKDYRISGRVYYKYSEVMEAAKHLKRYKKQYPTKN